MSYHQQKYQKDKVHKPKYAKDKMRSSSRQRDNSKIILASQINNYAVLMKLVASKGVKRVDIVWLARTQVKLPLNK